MSNTRVLKESIRGTEQIGIEDYFLSQRKLFLTEAVNAQTASELIEQVMYLDAIDSTQGITLFINSPGGEVASGLALYDVLTSVNSPVTTVCIGCCASMGAILFLAGSERKMLPHTTLMIHDPSYHNADIDGLKPHEIQRRVDSLNKTRKELVSIIAFVTGKNARTIEKITREDSYFSADEALDFGLSTETIYSLNRKETII